MSALLLRKIPLWLQGWRRLCTMCYPRSADILHSRVLLLFKFVRMVDGARNNRSASPVARRGSQGPHVSRERSWFSSALDNSSRARVCHGGKGGTSSAGVTPRCGQGGMPLKPEPRHAARVPEACWLRIPCWYMYSLILEYYTP